MLQRKSRAKKIVVLAGMIAIGKDELICDFAETYKIYEIENLSPEKAAILASGLRDDSRIKMKLVGQKVSFQTLLLAKIADSSTLNLYAKTKDAQKGKNKPKSIIQELFTAKKEKKEYKEFNSGEEFRKEWAKLCQI
jgi:hypothetical protein